MAKANSREKNIFLANVNENAREMYVDEVKNAVKQNKYHIEDEVAMLRKMCGAFLEYHVHGTPLPEDVVAEFTEYYVKVEDIKKALKEEIGI